MNMNKALATFNLNLQNKIDTFDRMQLDVLALHTNPM